MKFFAGCTEVVVFVLTLGPGVDDTVAARSAQDELLDVDRYFERYPGVAKYMETTRQAARERGFVETVFGRRLHLPDIASRNRQLQQYAERSAINAPMQGTAADIIKRAMIAVHDWLGRDALRARLVMQVHDELVLEVRETDLAAVREGVVARMAGAAELRVPLKVDTGVGSNWDEAH